jgi:peptidoglycan/LPS O-acetylase OafA/YrhL
LEWRFGFEAAFFIALLFLFLLLEIDSRILIFFALLFLLSCPFLLFFEQEFRAEQMAIYAYYLLFIGTVLALIESRRESKQDAVKQKVKKIRVAKRRVYEETG